MREGRLGEVFRDAGKAERNQTVLELYLKDRTTEGTWPIVQPMTRTVCIYVPLWFRVSERFQSTETTECNTIRNPYTQNENPKKTESLKHKI